MFTFIVYTSCLLYTLCSGQTKITVNQPALGTVYPVANNNSVLNLTFIYPTNYQFDNLYVRFTVYDFIGNNSLNPEIYPFEWVNFTNSNISLPWVVPNIILQSGDYIIVCFEWVQTNSSNQLITDTNQCILTRAPVNSVILAPASPISMVNVSGATISITAYYPAVLPYDQVSISSTLDGTIYPIMTDSTSNTTYSEISLFDFMNLTANTQYNLCLYYNYSNSKISGTQNLYTQCQNITTLGSGGGGSGGGGGGGGGGGNSSNKVIPKLTVFILLFIYAFI